MSLFEILKKKFWCIYDLNTKDNGTICVHTEMGDIAKSSVCHSARHTLFFMQRVE
jgi:hypothetical protein